VTVFNCDSLLSVVLFYITPTVPQRNSTSTLSTGTPVSARQLLWPSTQLHTN